MSKAEKCSDNGQRIISDKGPKARNASGCKHWQYSAHKTPPIFCTLHTGQLGKARVTGWRPRTANSAPADRICRADGDIFMIILLAPNGQILRGMIVKIYDAYCGLEAQCRQRDTAPAPSTFKYLSQRTQQRRCQ